MQLYYIDENLRKRNTAGAKAPDDIAAICEANKYRRIKMPMLFLTHTKFLKNVEILFKIPFFWVKLFAMIPKGTILLYQHPTLGKRLTSHIIPFLLRIKKIRIITLVHDLESLRGGISGVFKVGKTYSQEELCLLKNSEYIICHNKKMKEYLTEQGIKNNKLIELELFDYLTNEVIQEADKNPNEVCIAGNLAPGKCSYIYEMFSDGHNRNIHINLYGGNYEEKGIPNLEYHGSYNPDKLPGVLCGRFGIVWDGISASTCTGNTGDYLRYNNPHKTSLYLSAGIPVLIWEKAAMADFVKENKVGLCLESLYDLEGTLNSIDETDYEELKMNAEKMAERVRAGYFMNKAMNIVINELTKAS